jgi:hypothetical protein
MFPWKQIIEIEEKKKKKKTEINNGNECLRE